MRRISYALIIFVSLCIITTASDLAASGRINFNSDRPAASGEFIVKFRAGTFEGEPELADGVVQTSRKSIDAILNRLDAKMLARVFRTTQSALGDIYRLRFDAPIPLRDALEQMAGDPDVEWVEPNYLSRIFVAPNDTRFADQWGLMTIQAELAWGLSQGDASVIIAVIDTGVDYDHLDLEDNIWHNPGEIPDNGYDDDGNGFKDDSIGWDFVSQKTGGAAGEDMFPRDNDPMDFQGHGTHCAGIASAVTNNSIGVAGTGWNCKIMALRAGYETSGGAGMLLDSDTSAALEYAADNGAHVISMSWGGEGGSTTLLNAIQYAYNAGCVLVAAAGNDGVSDMHYPAAYTGVISVGASDQDDGRADFGGGDGSNYGAWVDIAAPGTMILSTIFHSSVHNDTYGWMQGTSMATPYVAGVAGLVLSYQGGLTPDEVAARLVDTGDDIDWGEPGPTKRVNAYQALLAANPPDTPTNFTATAVSGSQINLAWDDVAGETGYEIQRKETGGVFLAIDTTAADVTSYSDTGLGQSTTYIYRVCAYNGVGDSGWSNEASDTTFPNQPPVVSGIPNVPFDEDGSDNSVDLDDYVTDPDNPDSDMTWTYVGNTHVSVAIATDNVVTFTAPANWHGSEDIIFTATDLGGLSDNDIMTVTVNAVNDAPVVSGILNVSFDEDGSDNSVDLDDYVIDPDNPDSDMTWTYVGNAQVSVTIAADNVVTFTAPANWHGSEDITFTATDPGDLSDDDTMTVTVNAVNDPPTVSGIPNVSFDEDGSDNSVDLDDYVIDPDNPDSDMTWTYVGNAQVSVTIAADNVVTFTATANWHGSENITFTATDPGGLSDNDIMTVTVNAVNDPPAVSGIPNVSFDEDGSDNSVDLDNHVTDPDNFASEMTWTYTGSTQISVTIAADNVVTFTAPANWHGSENITFTATDPGGLSDDDTITVTVNAVNDPPVVSGIPNVQFDEDSLHTGMDLDAYVTDPDNPDGDMTWTYVGNAQVSVTIAADNVVTFTAPANWHGSEDITFTATDLGDLSDDDIMTVTVNAVNDPPAVSGIPNVSFDEDGSDNSVDLDNHVTDPDNFASEMTWTYTGSTQISVTIAADNVVTFTAPANWHGSENITFTATDPGGLSDDDTITVTVNAVNDPPVVSGIPNVQFDEDSLHTGMDLDAYVTDPDNSASDMTWTYTGNTQVSVTIAADNVVTFTALANWSGSENITFTATDPGGLGDDDTMTVTVSAVNDAPVVSGILNVSFDEDGSDNSVDLDAYVTDPDNSDNDMTWTYTGNTQVSVTIAADNVVTFTATANWSGSENITFTATDPGALNDSDIMTVTVNAVNDPPTVSDLVIEPALPNSDDDLQAFYTYNDIEGDPEVITGIKWYKDGAHQPYDDVLTIPSSATSPDEEWYFEATPSDGIDVGTTETSPAVLIEGLIQELRLYPGWNLISIYVDGEFDLLSVLAPIAGLYDSVWSYDAGVWRRYVPDGPADLNDLNTIERGKAYWIDITSDVEIILTITGQQILDTDVALYAGWNMVGYNSIRWQLRADALFSIAADLISIWTYDSIAGGWLKYDAGSFNFFNDLDQLVPGKGYWIFVQADCVWVVPH